LTASRFDRRTAASVRDPRSRQTIISGGSSESEHTAFAVRPDGPCSPVLVTTVTPVAKWLIADR
jgi:hypothetical protein